MLLRAPGEKLLQELAEAEDCAANGRADELDIVRLLEIAEELSKIRRDNAASRAWALAGRAVYAGAVD